MKFNASLRRNSALGSAVVAMCMLNACGKKEDAPAAAAPPPMQVHVYTVAPERIAITNDLPGRLEASRVAEVRARATGIVLKRLFREGSDVKNGQLLYKIDPLPLKAAFQNAAAATQRAEATAKQATLKAERYKPLVAASAISKQDYDDAIAAQNQANADVAAARATQETARLNLGYADVTSPINGRIGRELVTEGALVSATNSTQMAIVQQIDPIYLNITQSTNDVTRLQSMIAQGKLQSAGANAAKVTLVSDDGQSYGQAGKLLFTDFTVDPNTGSVSLRAEVPNPKHTLLPGMYVRARLEQGVAAEALTVPQQSVSRNAGGAFVYVANKDNKIEQRTITTDKAEGDRWIVSSGVSQGDRVLVDGLMKVHPGDTIAPLDWNAPAAAGASPDAAASSTSAASSSASQSAK